MRGLEKNWEKKAQVTIFIILALIIFFAIVLYFILQNSLMNSASVSARENPAKYMEDCIKTPLENYLNNMSLHGGTVSNQNNLIYSKNKVEYLCYTDKNNSLCNSKTSVTKKMEDELHNLMQKPIEDCFNNLGNYLSQMNYSQSSDVSYTVQIVPNSVIVNISREVYYDQDSNRAHVSSFSEVDKSPTFDFLNFANLIVRHETACACGNESCTANVFDLTRQNTDFDISVFVAGTGEKVYTIRELNSGKTFRFAVRNCVFQLIV